MSTVLIEQAITDASENYLIAWSMNDFELMKSITDATFIRNANGEITSGSQAELSGTMNFWHTALPDFNIVKVGDLVIKNDKSYIPWVSTGTNTGMLGENAPTSKKSKTHGFSVLTFNEAGKIIQELAYYDLLGGFMQMGYLLTPPASS